MLALHSSVINKIVLQKVHNIAIYFSIAIFLFKIHVRLIFLNWICISETHTYILLYKWFK